MIQKSYDSMQFNAYDVTQTIQHHTYDVRELVFQENALSGFKRLDVIVFLLSIENHYTLNDFGFALFRKMRDAQESEVRENMTNCLSDFVQFCKNSDKIIELDQGLHILNGLHKIAWALYSCNYIIPCKVLPVVNNVLYDTEWFIQHCFSQLEIQRIHERLHMLLDEIRIPFVCVLWAPASNFFDEIIEHLGQLSDVEEYDDYTYGPAAYAQMVRYIYAVDDIAKWKIEKKIQHMFPNEQKKITMRKVIISLPCPNYRRKRSNGNLISMRVEEIKRLIRDYFKDRIEDYFYDNIIHMGDNFWQNSYIAELFGIPRRLIPSIFERIEHHVISISVNSSSVSSMYYPEEWLLGSEVRIVCNPDSLQLVMDIIKKELLSLKPTRSYLREERGVDSSIKVCLEMDGILIYAFVVSGKGNLDKTSRPIHRSSLPKASMVNRFE